MVSSLKMFSIIISSFPLVPGDRFVIIVSSKLFQNLITFGLSKPLGVNYFLFPQKLFFHA